MAPLSASASSPNTVAPYRSVLQDNGRWVVEGPGMPVPPKFYFGQFHDAVAAALIANTAYATGRLAGEIFEMSRNLPAGDSR